jgi:hypothetical protein
VQGAGDDEGFRMRPLRAHVLDARLETARGASRPTRIRLQPCGALAPGDGRHAHGALGARPLGVAENDAMTHATLIRLIARADKNKPFPQPCFLESFDVDVHAPGVPWPTGSITTTPDATKALRFADRVDAYAAYNTQSAATPLRPDGGENRPLRLLTVVFEPVVIEEAVR